jgi:hypothetical protein
MRVPISLEPCGIETEDKGITDENRLSDIAGNERIKLPALTLHVHSAEEH